MIRYAHQTGLCEDLSGLQTISIRYAQISCVDGIFLTETDIKVQMQVEYAHWGGQFLHSKGTYAPHEEIFSTWRRIFVAAGLFCASHKKNATTPRHGLRPCLHLSRMNI